MGDLLAYKLTKDVVSCDKPRGAATGFDPWISEWGNLNRVMPIYLYLNT